MYDIYSSKKLMELNYKAAKEEISRRLAMAGEGEYELKEAEYEQWKYMPINAVLSIIRKRLAESQSTDVDYSDMKTVTGFIIGEEDTYGKKAPIRFYMLTDEYNGEPTIYTYSAYAHNGIHTPSYVEIEYVYNEKYKSNDIKRVLDVRELEESEINQVLDMLKQIADSTDLRAVELYSTVVVRGEVRRVYPITSGATELPLVDDHGRPTLIFYVVNPETNVSVRATVRPRAKAAAPIFMEGIELVGAPGAPVDDMFYRRPVIVVGNVTKVTEDIEREGALRVSMQVVAMYELTESTPAPASAPAPAPALSLTPSPASSPAPAHNTTDKNVERLKKYDRIKEHVKFALSVLPMNVEECVERCIGYVTANIEPDADVAKTLIEAAYEDIATED